MLRFVFSALTYMLLCAAPCCAERIELIPTDNSITVQMDDQLFTRYLQKSGNKPILWPILGPTGDHVTRAFPMRETANDATTDHQHHRSLWFAHGDVNGVDFWSEEERAGTIEHQEFVKIVKGSEPLIIAKNHWLDEDGVKVCSDMRAISFRSVGQQRWIDFDITVLADGEQPVTFGDTKEGGFALRVADSMSVEAGLGGKIINALENADEEAWGRTAAWVDYHGPVGKDEATVGIAILNHPSSFRFPTHWHVRTYGLFAANVFGLHNFKNSHDENGSHTLQPGESFSLFYRVVLHPGDERQARIAEAFVEYAKQVKMSVPEILAAEEAAEESILTESDELLDAPAAGTVGGSS